MEERVQVLEEPKVTQLNNLIEINGIKMTIPCDKLLEALAKMQGALDNAPKTSKNPYFNSRYADLATCLSALKKPMSDNGLSISQHCTFDGAILRCVSILGHSSGQMMISVLNVPVTKKDPQGIGMAMTYARRYAMSSIVGLAQADDDAESSVEHNGEEKENKENSVSAAENQVEKESNGYATEKQVSLIKSMIEKARVDINSVLKRYSVANLESLSKEQASNCIRTLNKQVSGK